MKNSVLTLFYRLLIFIPFIILMVGCSSSKNKYQKAYNMVWKEMIQSEAWKNSLVAHNVKTASETADFYSSTADVILTSPNSSTSLNSEALPEKYDDLVSRAYFKIIVQAEKANDQLKKEYDYWNSETVKENVKKDKDFKQNQALVNKKYTAHKAMLEGLKSWNIFSENRSGDLDFFKAENEIDTYRMLQQGESEERIVNLLVYKLADLYHFEEQ